MTFTLLLMNSNYYKRTNNIIKIEINQTIKVFD